MGIRRNAAAGPTALGGQDATLITGLLAGVVANGVGPTADVEGYNGAMILDVWNTGTGTATFSVEGSDDGGTTWWGLGVDVMASGTGVGSTVAAAAGTLTRAASVTVAASGSATAAQRLAILDPAVQLRCRLASISGAVAFTANLLALGA
jgi:hypothetical protein